MRKIALMVLVLSGCGADGGGGGPTTLPEYQLAILSSFCDLGIRCGGLGASEKALCLQLAQVQVRTAVDFQALIDARHIAFDAAKASVCLDAQRRATCDGGIDAVGQAACRDATHGLIPPGGGCVTSNECDGGWCDNASRTGCTGKCVAYVATGASCAGGGRCNSIIDFCDVTSTCKPRRKAGDGCTASFHCQDGLICLSGAHTCARPGTAGAPCTPQDACADGFYCDAGSSTCKARIGAGSACDAANSCEDGLVCVGFDRMRMGSKGMCRAWLDAGASCVTLTPTIITGCPEDMTCDATSKCEPKAGLGAPCMMDQDCSAALCDTMTHKCILPSGYGEACTPPAKGGREPCVSGACDPASKTCKLACG